MQTSLPSRHSECESLYTQKSDLQHQSNTPGSTPDSNCVLKSESNGKVSIRP